MNRARTSAIVLLLASAAAAAHEPSVPVSDGRDVAAPGPAIRAGGRRKIRELVTAIAGRRLE